MDNLEIVERWSSKVKPIKLEKAQGEALQVNGYNEAEWVDAPPLREVMLKLNAKTKGATTVAYNAPFDDGYLVLTFHDTNVADERGDGYICLLRLAHLWIPADKIENYKLKTVCRYLGIPEEDTVHRVLAGAEIAYKILKFFHDHRPDFSRDRIS
jgi:DNA polymerase III epsilon subunit-like protein